MIDLLMRLQAACGPLFYCGDKQKRQKETEMADNSIQVEAKVNTSQLKTGLHEAIAAVSEAVTEMKAQFSEVAAAATKAFDSEGASTRFFVGLRIVVLRVRRFSELTASGFVAIYEPQNPIAAAGGST